MVSVAACNSDRLPLDLSESWSLWAQTRFPKQRKRRTAAAFFMASSPPIVLDSDSSTDDPKFDSVSAAEVSSSFRIKCPIGSKGKQICGLGKQDACRRLSLRFDLIV